MRSILAQFEFANLVLEWTSKGVPFQTHLYVPEVHPVTKMTFCEREDEAHVPKVGSSYLIIQATCTCTSHCSSCTCIVCYDILSLIMSCVLFTEDSFSNKKWWAF